MKFGKLLDQAARPDWAVNYVNYKVLDLTRYWDRFSLTEQMSFAFMTALETPES